MLLISLLLNAALAGGESECRLDSDCAYGMECSTSGDGFVDDPATCRPAPDLADGACHRHEDCAEGFACDTEIGACFEQECMTDMECSLGQVCEGGRCATDLEADADRDGVPDNVDNCRDVANPGQDDVDGDGRGDLCDSRPDRDGDGYPDEEDLCPEVYDHQDDADGDGQGDACDLCPFDAAAAHIDTDGDGFGNICDPDDDDDCVLDEDDNCPSIANPGQHDTDGDGRGDACDEGALALTLAQCAIEEAIDGLADDLCCTESESPGACGEDACTDAVCGLDPYCCDVQWDAICAEAASTSASCSCGMPVIDLPLGF